MTLATTGRSAAPSDARTARRAPRVGRSRRTRRWRWSSYLYVLPALAFYATFTLRPIATTVWTSFFDWNGITLAEWVGLDNYRSIVVDPLVRQALGHSLAFVFFYALLPTAVGLVLTGLIVRTRIRGLVVFRSLLFLPQILSSVVVAAAWRWIYDVDGPLNALLAAVGLGRLHTAWLGDFDTALPSMGLIGTWVEFGLCLCCSLPGRSAYPMSCSRQRGSMEPAPCASSSP